MKRVDLPIVNDLGYYEMRLESIGGLGANLCGKLLGELGAMYLGLGAASFASYGSEKRGSPVKSYIRWCRPGKEVRINSPVHHPHVLGIFHEALLDSYPVLQGMTENTRLIINAPCKQKHWPAQAEIVDAGALAMRYKSRVNMVMLGAIAKATGLVSLESLKELISHTLGQRYPALLASNIKGVRAGYDVVDERAPKGDAAVYESEKPRRYEEAATGGVITCIGNIVTHDLSASREGWIPLFHPDRCIHCGLCDSTCPDMVFQFAVGEQGPVNRGLDYQHCKGCLRCVAVCPVQALTAVKEREWPEKPYALPNQSLITADIPMEASGANSWMSSEAQETERRIEE